MFANRAIDLRSDTVTQPTEGMRAAMFEAPVGDDVYGEDPTANRLEALGASILGTEDAILVSSGTQGNLIALLVHCQRGDEYIVGDQLHSYRSEAGGAAVLGGIQAQTIPTNDDGTLALELIEAAIKPDDFHYPRTRLVCIENTQGGRVLTEDYVAGVAAITQARGLALHLDGARLFNAAVKLDVPAADFVRHVDSVSICLSKGLGAPAGSLLCGTREFVARARRTRKLLGGAMRQIGFLAGAGIYALENHVERLAEDHATAARLEEKLLRALGDHPEVQVAVRRTETNMVFVDFGPHHAALSEHLRARGILISNRNPVRLVTHLDVSERDIDAVVEAMAEFFASATRPAA